jgi:Flp pilus assembly protein TadD/cell division protein FtsN
MNIRTILNLTGSALVLGGTMVGCATGQTHLASAATKAEGRSIASAETAAKKANVFLARHDAVRAVSFAETAVSLRPQDGTYRALLGKAYLASGRFASARQAFVDALSLDAGQPGVALNLALAETALGDVAAARETLAGHADRIAPVDRGLALALAGDPAAGLEILQAATRAPDANAKTRQNLALAYALAGRWPDARVTAMIDLPPAEADARIIQWASFVRPAGSADQVASLLGVTPTADGGQPQMLALVTQAGGAGVETAAAQTAPGDSIDAYMPAAPVDTGIAAAAAPEPTHAMAVPTVPVEVAQVAPTDVPAPIAAPSAAPLVALTQIIFGPPREVVQPIAAQPTRVVRNVPARAAVGSSSTGNYVVQLGAFRTADAARTAWGRVRGQVALDGRAPSSAPVKTRGGTFYRLSVSGFERGEAANLCVRLKASGGTCFVRATAGDQVASWGPARQVASR